jgi:hypothetical protein
LAGEPTPPMRLSGTDTNRNSHRPDRAHASASGPKSNSSPIANPSPVISRPCRNPTERSPGTTSTAGLSQATAATPESHRNRAIDSLPDSPAAV